MTFKNINLLVFFLFLLSACGTPRETAQTDAEKAKKEKPSVDPKKTDIAEMTERPQLEDFSGSAAKPKDGELTSQGQAAVSKWASEANEGKLLSVDVQVGGGLNDLNFQVSPNRVKPVSTRPGVVVMQVCIGKNGMILASQFQQKGSTSHSRILINYAQDYIRACRFEDPLDEKTCGTMTFTFE